MKPSPLDVRDHDTQPQVSGVDAVGRQAEGAMTLFLSGDVMTGRGVDQILPHPGDPELSEAWIQDARRYVDLAESAHGPIARPAPFDWPWGDALATLDRIAPSARVINLETSVTRSGGFAPGKAVCYRMNPANLPTLTAVRPDVCILANNHVLDFGPQGLLDTLDALSSAGITTAGAGRDLGQAREPAIATAPGGRIVVIAAGSTSAGVPEAWAAAPDRPGVDLVSELSDAEADGIIERAAATRRPGDLLIVSLHWGSNWGYAIPPDQIRFAHRLIDGGADIVHGHSSHHPRPIEIYRGRLILYGCGDLINDYEGISGHEEFRDDLHLLYFPEVHPPTGELTGLRMSAVRSRRMRLQNTPHADTVWLRARLEEAGRRFRTRLEVDSDDLLALRIP